MPSPNVDTPTLIFSGNTAGPSIVLGNSLGSDVSMWEPQLQALGAAFRLVRFNYPGHGGTATWPATSATALAQSLLRALDEAGVERFFYCGLSLGGAVGMELALLAPARMDAMVLSNTAAHFGATPLWASRMAQAREQGVASLRQATVARWLTPDHQARDPLLVSQLQEMFSRTRLDGYLQACQLVCDFDFRSRLGLIRVPTLVIAGSQDQATTPAQGQALASGIQGSQYLELAAAHFANLGQSAAFNQAVSTFFHHTAPETRHA